MTMVKAPRLTNIIVTSNSYVAQMDIFGSDTANKLLHGSKNTKPIEFNEARFFDPILSFILFILHI